MLRNFNIKNNRKILDQNYEDASNFRLNNLNKKAMQKNVIHKFLADCKILTNP
jgi:hypothetical protein